MKKATIYIADTENLSGNLPPEIVTEVLYRLPVKSLCCFKCVSSSWKALISSPHFVQTHLTRTKANNHPRKAILLTRSSGHYSVDFARASLTPKKLNFPCVDGWYNYLSSCCGLVLLSSKGFVNFLLNPSTSEWKELPKPFLEYSSSYVRFPPELGYVSSTDDYKVAVPILMAEPKPNHADVTIVAVYSLKTNAWRTIQDFPCHPPLGHGRGVCFNERLNWLCQRTDGLDSSKVVVAFDLADEIFSEVQLPASYDDDINYYDMVVLGACLCWVVWSNSDRIDVWMMMEYGVRESWRKLFSIANPGDSIMDVLCLSAHDELVLRRLRRERLSNIRGRKKVEFDGEKLILFNPIQGTRREVLVPGFPTRPLIGEHYIETLRSPNHGGRFSETT